MKGGKMAEVLYRALSYEVVGAAMTVHTTLGSALLHRGRQDHPGAQSRQGPE